jgi:hypothetical protein
MRALPALLLGSVLAAQSPENPGVRFYVPLPPEAIAEGFTPQGDSSRAITPGKAFPVPLKDLPAFLGGALVGLVIHESGHYAMERALGADPYVKHVEGAGIPFFAVSYRNSVSPKQEYAITSAGFWMQHAMSEAILAKYPRVWQEAPPSVRGAFAFHLVTSLIYAYAALAKSGPPERDTLGMAHGLGISERWVGLAVFLPAALDLYRSLHPNVPWATWTSRGVKIGFVFALTK